MNRNEGNKPIGILLIEDNRDDADLLKATLSEAKSLQSVCEVQGTLSQGIERLSRGGIHIVLLDLGLPDSLGFATFEQLTAEDRLLSRKNRKTVPALTEYGHSPMYP